MRGAAETVPGPASPRERTRARAGEKAEHGGSSSVMTVVPTLCLKRGRENGPASVAGCRPVLSVTRRGRRSGGLFGFSLGRFLGGPSGLFGGLGALGGDRGHHARAEDDGGAREGRGGHALAEPEEADDD